MGFLGERGAAMRVPQRVLERAQAVLHGAEAFAEGRISLVVGRAQAGELLVLLEVLRGGEDARFCRHDAPAVDSFGCERLQRGGCTIELGFIFTDLLTNFERISDHCSNIAAYVIQTAMHTMATHEYMHVLKDLDNGRYEEMRKEYLEKYKLK